jgi:4-oxalocrotonate tautomerase
VPIVTVTLPEQISDRTKASISDEIVNITSRLLNKKEQVTVVKFMTGHADFFNLGKQSEGVFPFDIEIKITTGTNNEDEKAEWIGSIWELMNIYFQTGDNFPCYISIIEVDGNNWGFNGMTQRNRALANQ